MADLRDAARQYGVALIGDAAAAAVGLLALTHVRARLECGELDADDLVFTVDADGAPYVTRAWGTMVLDDGAALRAALTDDVGRVVIVGGGPAGLSAALILGLAFVAFSGEEEGTLGSGWFVAHAPVVVTGAGRPQFHMSRRNRSAGQFAGRQVLISGDCLTYTDPRPVVGRQESCSFVQRLGADLQGAGDLLEDLGGRFAQAAFDLGQVRIRDPGPLGDVRERLVLGEVGDGARHDDDRLSEDDRHDAGGGGRPVTCSACDDTMAGGPPG